MGRDGEGREGKGRCEKRGDGTDKEKTRAEDVEMRASQLVVFLLQ